MRSVRPIHVLGTSALILLVCFCFALWRIPLWAIGFAAVIGVLGPVLLYLFSDEPPTDPNGNLLVF